MLLATDKDGNLLAAQDYEKACNALNWEYGKERKRLKAAKEKKRVANATSSKGNS